MSKEPNKTIEVEIHALGSSGEGVGDLDGYKVFIEGALPGERVRARLTTSKKTYAKGEVEEILTSSPDRIEAPCPFYAECGGCQLQHLKDTAQLDAKRQRVHDALKRIGQIDLEPLPCRPSPTTFGYRNKIQLPVTADGIGLYRRNSHDIVPVDHCMVHCDLGEKVYKVIQAYIAEKPFTTIRHLLIRSAVNTKQVLVALITTGQHRRRLVTMAHAIMERCPEVRGVVECINRGRDNVIMGKEFHTLAGVNEIEETVCGLQFRISSASFFQVNPRQAEELYQSALEYAQLTSSSTIIDAYCGVGTLALLAAQKASSILGIECVPEAVKDAENNALLNGITNATFECGLTENVLPVTPSADVVFLNPPRKGCERKVLEALISHSPKRIVYVSCDPATLARDLRILVEAGFEVETVEPFDMFPQTAHVETIAAIRGPFA